MSRKVEGERETSPFEGLKAKLRELKKQIDDSIVLMLIDYQEVEEAVQKLEAEMGEKK